MKVGECLAMKSNNSQIKGKGSIDSVDLRGVLSPKLRK